MVFLPFKIWLLESIKYKNVASIIFLLDVIDLAPVYLFLSILYQQPPPIPFLVALLPLFQLYQTLFCLRPFALAILHSQNALP